MIRLFTLGEEIEGGLALTALGEAGNSLIDAGILAGGNGRVRSRFQICPVGDSWVLCDFSGRQADRTDFVMGVGPSSELLSSLVPPMDGRVLDLGCGAGWLSTRLAHAGMDVTAVDVNPRALALARFTAKLSGASGIRFLQGNGLDAVAGREFDLIVSNPPYVQSPGGAMLYRESRVEGSVCEDWLRGVSAHLASGGVAVVLLNWMHRDDEKGKETPLSWVDAAGNRRWLFQTECSAPATYAWKWISVDPAFRDEAAATAEMDRWLGFYRSLGIGRISGGFMVVQRCAGKAWTRFDSRRISSVSPHAGEEVRRILENTTWLQDEPDILARRFQVPNEVRAEARMTLDENGWSRETIRLSSAAGLTYDGQIDENVMRLLEILRRGGSPADMVAELRAKPEFPTTPDLEGGISELVRGLIHHAVLVPA